MPSDLPTYAEARSECLENDNPSAISWFITEHEGGRPGSLEEQTFRADLHAVVEEAKCQGFQEAEGLFDAFRTSRNGVGEFTFWYGFFCGLCAMVAFVAFACLVFGVAW